jgi:hypothetical protein
MAAEADMALMVIEAVVAPDASTVTNLLEYMAEALRSPCKPVVIETPEADIFVMSMDSAAPAAFNEKLPRELTSKDEIVALPARVIDIPPEADTPFKSISAEAMFEPSRVKSFPEEIMFEL